MQRLWWGKSGIGYQVIPVILVCVLVFVSGCQNLNLGGTQVADFGGNSPNAQEMMKCFFNKYGDPASYAGPPRFLEPMVSDGISDNLPTDKVTAFSKDTPTVYVWAFYEGFKQGDTITAVWTFNGQQFASLSKQAGGNYGIVSGQFDKPPSGWAVGTHTIMISGNGVQGSVTFDIIEGATVTEELPCSQDGGTIPPTPQGPITSATISPTAVQLVARTPVQSKWTQPKVAGAQCIYAFVKEWGSRGSGSQAFNNPYGIAVDSARNVYVVDTENNCIKKFDSNGNLLTKWGEYGTGEGLLFIPYGIAVDSAGNVFVSDTGNNRIQRFSSDGNYINTREKFEPPGGLNIPEGVAVGPSGGIYVADMMNNRVPIFDSNGYYYIMLHKFGTGEGELDEPEGVAVDSAGNAYVADTGNHRIQKFDSTGVYVSMWGKYGTGSGELYYPRGIAVDSAGNVYVADTGNDRIQKFDSDGKILTMWGKYGTGPGEFNNPAGVAVDYDGYVYVADTSNNRIQKFACVQPNVVQLITTPTINYPVKTPLKVITPTLFPSTPPTTTPTTVPTTPKVVILNTTPTTPIPKYKGYSI